MNTPRIPSFRWVTDSSDATPLLRTDAEQFIETVIGPAGSMECNGAENFFDDDAVIWRVSFDPNHPDRLGLHHSLQDPPLYLRVTWDALPD